MVGVKLTVHTLVVTCSLLALPVFFRLSHCRYQLCFFCSPVVHEGFSTGTASVPSMCLNEDTHSWYTGSSLQVQCTLFMHSVHLSVASSLFCLPMQSDGRASSVPMAWLNSVCVRHSWCPVAIVVSSLSMLGLV